MTHRQALDADSGGPDPCACLECRATQPCGVGDSKGCGCRSAGDGRTASSLFDAPWKGVSNADDWTSTARLLLRQAGMRAGTALQPSLPVQVRTRQSPAQLAAQKASLELHEDCGVGALSPPNRQGPVGNLGVRHPELRPKRVRLLGGGCPPLAWGEGQDAGFSLAQAMQERLRASRNRGPTRRHEVLKTPGARAAPLPGGRGGARSLPESVALHGSMRRQGPGTVRIRYRSVSFEVTDAFYDDYVRDLVTLVEERRTNGEGLVSSVGDALDALWPTFRADAAATGVPFSAYHDLLGCYNLPRSDIHDQQTYLFWSDGWGGPHKVHLYACALAQTYAHTVVDINDNPWCRDFSRFLSTVLAGGGAQQLDGEALEPAARRRDCGVTIHYLSADEANAWVHNPPSLVSSDVLWDSPCSNDPDSTWACTEGFRQGEEDLCLGRPWNAFSPSLIIDNARSSYTYLADADYPRSTEAPYPWDDTACLFYAFAGQTEWSAQFRALQLGWDGFNCDYILYLARMAWDYARYAGERMLAAALGDTPDLVATWGARYLQAEAAARPLAGFALSIILSRTRVLVHELGHVYLGGSPHCGYDEATSAARWAGCFESAAQHFKVRVAARLGVSMDPYVGFGYQQAVAGSSARDTSPPSQWGWFDFYGNRRFFTLDGSPHYGTTELSIPFSRDACAHLKGFSLQNSRIDGSSTAQRDRRAVHDFGFNVRCTGTTRWQLDGQGVPGVPATQFCSTAGCRCQTLLFPHAVSSRLVSQASPDADLSDCIDRFAARGRGAGCV